MAVSLCAGNKTFLVNYGAVWTGTAGNKIENLGKFFQANSYFCGGKTIYITLLLRKYYISACFEDWSLLGQNWVEFQGKSYK